MNKISYLLLLIVTINLYAGELVKIKRKRTSRPSHYILSASYLNGLEEQSEHNLDILDNLYNAVELGKPHELIKLLTEHPSECKRFLGKYHEKPTRASPLHTAVVRGDPDIVRILVAHNVDINIPDETFIGNNNTPLHYAAKLNKPTCLQICQILIKRGARIDSKNKLGQTPLHMACESSDNPDIIKRFIYYGAEIDAQSSSGLTPLHIAVTKGYPEVTQVLLACKADIHARTTHGLTPLHIAVAKGDFKVVEILLSHGAKPWYIDHSNRTPMQVAKENIEKYPNNRVYRDIRMHLEAYDTFDSFLKDLLDSEEPASKRRRTDDSEQN